MNMRFVSGVYLADTARVLGEVEIGRDVSIWYGVSIRGDVAKITIGEGTNIQDNAVVHCDSGVPNVIGSHVTVGHGAIVHGAAVGDGSLIGMGATLLGRSRVGKRCLVAAGALVVPGMEVPDGMMAVGVPAKVLRGVSEEEKRYLAWLAPHYVALAKLHHEKPGDERVKAWGS